MERIICMNSGLILTGFDTLRIAIFSESWVPNLNGVVISIINEVQSLKNKHDFVIFVPKLKKSKPFKIEGIPIYEFWSVPFPPYPGYKLAIPSISFSKAIKKEECFDLVHSHGPFSLGYAAVLTARVFYDLPFCLGLCSVVLQVFQCCDNSFENSSTSLKNQRGKTSGLCLTKHDFKRFL